MHRPALFILFCFALVACQQAAETPPAVAETSGNTEPPIVTGRDAYNPGLCQLPRRWSRRSTENGPSRGLGGALITLAGGIVRTRETGLPENAG